MSTTIVRGNSVAEISKRVVEDEPSLEEVSCSYQSYIPPISPTQNTETRGRKKKVSISEPQIADDATKEAFEKNELLKLKKKCREYYDSNLLPQDIRDAGLPKDNAPLSQWKQVYASYVGYVKSKQKQMMILHFYDMACTGIETMAVQGFQKLEFVGVKNFFTSEDFLDSINPELEEIAIEMSDSWVPSPHVRLAMKLGTAFLNYNEIKKQKAYADDVQNQKLYDSDNEQ